ncbi:MAG TPA: hypothetical protein GX717_01735 [Clostridiaceae bacterium]|nr:hypothetical protein [Clostridiaceae bacterium]
MNLEKIQECRVYEAQWKIYDVLISVNRDEYLPNACDTGDQVIDGRLEGEYIIFREVIVSLRSTKRRAFY